MASQNVLYAQNDSDREKALFQMIHRCRPDLKTRHDILLEALYEQLPEKQKADIVKGKIILEDCPALPAHDLLIAILLELLHHFSEIHPELGFPLGQMTLLEIPPLSPLDEPTAREPDIFWVSRDQSDLLNGAKFSGCPLLIIEILASTELERKKDLEIKCEEYARLGVSEYWIIDLWRNDSKFGTLNKNEYEWKTWADFSENDPELHSTTIPGFYLKKSWVTLSNGQLPSVQSIDPFITSQIEEERRQKEEERRVKIYYLEKLKSLGIKDEELTLPNDK
jgi:Uma2 family endonuclease